MPRNITMYRLVPKHALLPTGALVLKSTLVPIFFFVAGWWLLGAMLQADRPSVSVVKTIQVYIYRNIAAICTKNWPFMSQKVRSYQKLRPYFVQQVPRPEMYAHPKRYVRSPKSAHPIKDPKSTLVIQRMLRARDASVLERRIDPRNTLVC